MEKVSLSLSIHDLAGFKRITFSLIIVLLVISLSVPVYAPARRIDYIDRMPVVPVADVSMSYQDVIVRSLTTAGAGWGGGFVGELGQRNIVIDCIGYGIVSITWTTSGSVGNFVQRFSLNVVIADAIRTGEPLEVAGRSNLTLFTTEGRITFKGIIYGNATFSDVGGIDTYDLQLSLVGNSPLGPIISLQIHGIFSQPVDPELSMTAEGQILARLEGG